MKTADFNTEKFDFQKVSPGDLVVWDDKMHIAINRTTAGFLIKDCNTGAGINVSQSDKLSIIKNIQIRNR